ncbi:zinc finger protein 888-like [Adelges cooleyi]|uniref:zinc finger protein 888-like n=1 Tax=Adelges cooleyi TaxID=133065 RepID=UPI00217FB13A|nr:zinc finger protein 888-like [Adelges cooleyi]
MDNSQTHLHSENFDLCRICLLEPESNRTIKFLNIFTSTASDNGLSQNMTELLGVRVEKDDIKPKIICENCHKSLLSWVEMKKKATESQIVINYIAKKFGTNVLPKVINPNSVEPTLPIDSQSHSLSSLKRNTSLPSDHQIKTNNQINCTSSNQNHIRRPIKKSPSISSESDDVYENPLDDSKNDVICISDSEESINDENTTCNDKKNNQMYYCSICKKKKFNHDCSQFNKEFSTCLVPNCTIIFRSGRDFMPHYRQHIGMPSGVGLCRQCFKENKKTERDINGQHIHGNMNNLFKCYTCNILFGTMVELAQHKRTKHNGRLINSTGNYLCFFCEKSSSDLSKINDHIKICRDNQIATLGQEKPSINAFSNKKELATKPAIVKKAIKKDVIEHKKEKNTMMLSNIHPIRTSTLVLFTCLKPSCNIISQSFQSFKAHCRDHLNIGNNIMCWQCVSDFPDLASLRLHQMQGKCQKPGMFECFECNTKYDDIQSLSVHKLIVHDCTIVAKNKKTLLCPFCKIEHNINTYRNHLIECQIKSKNKVSSNETKSKLLVSKSKFSYKCTFCKKVCQTRGALSNHLKKHGNITTENLYNSRLKFKTNTVSSNNKLANSNIVVSNNDLIMEDSNDDTSQNMIESSENKPVDVDMFPNVNKLYFCIKCPKKFVSQTGLTEHWNHCSNVGVKKIKSKKNLPANYYCTKCKEYYTCVGFTEHWRIKHGKKLVSNKYKRFQCGKCHNRFKYKIALMMHREHSHNEKEVSSVVDKKTVDCVVMLPIISQTTSLAVSSSKETQLDSNLQYEEELEKELIAVIDDTVNNINDNFSDKQESETENQTNNDNYERNDEAEGQMVNNDLFENEITKDQDKSFKENSVERDLLGESEMDVSIITEENVQSNNEQMLIDNIQDVIEVEKVAQISSESLDDNTVNNKVPTENNEHDYVLVDKDQNESPLETNNDTS